MMSDADKAEIESPEFGRDQTEELFGHIQSALQAGMRIELRSEYIPDTDSMPYRVIVKTWDQRERFFTQAISPADLFTTKTAYFKQLLTEKLRYCIKTTRTVVMADEPEAG